LLIDASRTMTGLQARIIDQPIQACLAQDVELDQIRIEPLAI
jgi:hypothetical protein